MLDAPGAPTRRHPELASTSRGRGPVVVLVHGVGFGPSLFEAVVTALARDRRVVVPWRRGYGGSAPGARPPSVDDHVADLVDLLDRDRIDRATFVGVSGGATIVTALAITVPDRAVSVVAHEPLLGSVARPVWDRVSEAFGALDGTDDVEAFARALAGPGTWESIARQDRPDGAGMARTVRAEVPGFLAFSPTPSDLSAISVALTSSVGERSGPERHEAAATLAALTGRPAAVVPNAGHLAHVDAPGSFADLIRSLPA